MRSDVQIGLQKFKKLSKLDDEQKAWKQEVITSRSTSTSVTQLKLAHLHNTVLLAS